MYDIGIRPRPNSVLVFMPIVRFQRVDKPTLRCFFFFLGVIFFLFMQSVGAFPFSLEDNFSESSSNIYVMSYNSVFVLFRLTLGKVSVFSFFVVHFVTFRASVIPSWA